MNLVAEALQAFRRDTGLTQKAVGELLDISQQSERLLESGAQHPSLHTLRLIAKLFNWTAIDVGNFVLTIETKKKHLSRVRKAYIDAPKDAEPQK